MVIPTFLVLIILFLGGAAAASIFFLVRENGDLRKRHDHNTLAGLFDANALSVDSHLEAVEFAERMMTRLRMISQILGEASTPYAYDKNHPSRRDQAEESAHLALINQLESLVKQLKNGRGGKR